MAVKRKSAEPAASLPPSAAEMLIASVQQAKSNGPPDPSSDALAELRKLVEYNDSCASFSKRVSYAQAIDLLREHGWTGSTRYALNHVCARLLGRTSFGQA